MITLNLVQSLQSIILETWSHIAQDAVYADDNVERMECVLDELRKSTEATRLLKAAYREHGWYAVVDFLSNNIQLAA